MKALLLGYGVRTQQMLALIITSTKHSANTKDLGLKCAFLILREKIKVKRALHLPDC